MKKFYLYIMIFLLILPSAFTNSDLFNETEKLEREGLYKQSLELLLNEYEKNKDIKVAWRIGRASFLLSEETNNKKEKLSYFEIGTNKLHKYIEKEAENNKDYAEAIHWYLINYASTIKEKGIFAGREALTIVPYVFKMIDKIIEADPDYAGAYFFKGKFMGEIPGFLGGNKVKMEYNLKKAIEKANNDEKIIFYYEIAQAIKKRNWNLERKKTQFKKEDIPITQSFSADLSDTEVAEMLYKKIKTLYSEQENPSVKEKEILSKLTD